MGLVTHIDTVFVPARDTEAAARWYARVFGMEPIFESAGYIGLRFVGAPEGAAALTLYPVEAIDGGDHYRFNFYSPDPDALRSAVLAEGLEATEVKAAGPIRYFDFRDITGNWINVCAPGAAG